MRPWLGKTALSPRLGWEGRFSLTFAEVGKIPSGISTGEAMSS